MWTSLFLITFISVTDPGGVCIDSYKQDVEIPSSSVIYILDIIFTYILFHHIYVHVVVVNPTISCA